MSFGCKVCPKSFQLLTDLLKHFKVHVHPETSNQKKKTFKKLTPNLNCKSENNEMDIDIDGTVIKFELKSPLTQHQMLNMRNENQREVSDDNKYKNQASDQNVLLIEETIDTKLGNEEIRSYICRKILNSEEHSSALKGSYTEKAQVKEQLICEICKKSFSRKSHLRVHVQTVHDGVKEHRCEICGKTFGEKSTLRTHGKVHELVKPHKCISCDKNFRFRHNLERHVMTIHENIKAFKCETCDKSFGRKAQLKIHFRTVHENIKAFKCDSCKKKLWY